MKLNTDMRQLAAAKKAVYPTKRSMNLYFKVDRTTAPATVALYVLFALVVLAALSKVMVYDLWAQEQLLQDQAAALEQRTAQQMEQLSDYETVRENYIRSVPTRQEREQADVIELLELIDNTIRPAAQISQISIAGHEVVVAFSGVTLAQAADLVAELESSPLVDYTQVDTASATSGNNQVEIHVYFQVAQEEIAS